MEETFIEYRERCERYNKSGWEQMEKIRSQYKEKDYNKNKCDKKPKSLFEGL